VQIAVSGEELSHVPVPSGKPRILSDWKLGLGATHRYNEQRIFYYDLV